MAFFSYLLELKQGFQETPNKVHFQDWIWSPRDGMWYWRVELNGRVWPIKLAHKPFDVGFVGEPTTFFFIDGAAVGFFLSSTILRINIWKKEKKYVIMHSFNGWRCRKLPDITYCMRQAVLPNLSQNLTFSLHWIRFHINSYYYQGNLLYSASILKLQANIFIFFNLIRCLHLFR